jgi:hypothetical protein
MSIHQKLAERLASTGDNWGFTASFSIHRGDFDDILGVQEPTLEDVQREARRALGKGSVEVTSGGAETSVYFRRPGGSTVSVVWAPTIAATYAALRALPDCEVKP